MGLRSVGLRLVELARANRDATAIEEGLYRLTNGKIIKEVHLG